MTIVAQRETSRTYRPNPKLCPSDVRLLCPCGGMGNPADRCGECGAKLVKVNPTHVLDGFKLGAFRTLLRGTLQECEAEKARRAQDGWSNLTIQGF